MFFAEIAFLLSVPDFQAVKNGVVVTDWVTDLENFVNQVKKHVRSPTHLSATTAFTLLGKVRTDEAVNEGAQLGRFMYNEH